MARSLLAAPLLVEAGHTVHSVIRNPEHVGEVETTGANAVLADVETLDAGGWDELLRGKDAVVWSAGAGGGGPERTRAVDLDAAVASMNAAERVGARRYVMVSYFGASLEHGVPVDNPSTPTRRRRPGPTSTCAAPVWTGRSSAPGLTLEEPTGRIDTAAAESGTVSRGNVARAIVAALAEPGSVGTFVTFNDGEQEIGEAFAALS